MKCVFSKTQLLHDPRFFLSKGRSTQNPEQPDRASRLLEAVTANDLPVVPAENFGPGPRAAVHSPQYLDFLEHAYIDWQTVDGQGGELIPSLRPVDKPASYPRNIVGRAGWHMADMACPIGPNTWVAACASANTAVTAAQLLVKGAREAYALCRPPGHHATANLAGGFCFLNNTAIAAQHLHGQHQRVAILDVDVHHGNGTQSIFYRRNDVFTVSIHADPASYYPFFSGYPHEVGEREGQGCNLNLPVPLRSGDDVWLAALNAALAAIAVYDPGVLVVALGLDAYEHDPLAGGAVTSAGFHRIAEAIASLDLPTLIVQEGGYLCDDFGSNLSVFLDGFLTER